MTQIPPVDPLALIDSFYDGSATVGEFREVPPGEIPQPFRHLLHHHRHMTVAVEKFHESPISVEVLQSTTQDKWYSREIVLRRKTDRQVVQYGIVRLNLELVSPSVRAEILAAQKPLGRILIEHKVLRAVKLLTLFRFAAGPVLQRVFSIGPETVCYGRTAVILCDMVPAIQLLEILSPSDSATTA